MSDEERNSPDDDGSFRTRRLRDFSNQLAERLKTASSTANEPMRLAIRIGTTGYVLDMNAAAEIVATPPVTPVPWTQPWFRGLTNVRGRLIGVIDLQHLSRRQPLPTEMAQQLLVFGDSLRSNGGVLVTRAFGLRNLNDLEPLGPAVEGADPWEGARWRDLDGNELVELKLAALVASDVYASIGF